MRWVSNRGLYPTEATDTTLIRLQRSISAVAAVTDVRFCRLGFNYIIIDISIVNSIRFSDTQLDAIGRQWTPNWCLLRLVFA